MVHEFIFIWKNLVIRVAIGLEYRVRLNRSIIEVRQRGDNYMHFFWGGEVKSWHYMVLTYCCALCKISKNACSCNMHNMNYDRVKVIIIHVITAVVNIIPSTMDIIENRVVLNSDPPSTYDIRFPMNKKFR